MKSLRALATAAVLIAIPAGVVSPAAAAGPTIERIPIDDTFVDEGLSAECGVTVTARAVGQLTFKTWDRTGTGPLDMTNINIAITFTAGDNSYRVRDVGADLLRREPDGSLVVLVIGQVPFGFSGVLKIDPETGEVLHEPQHLQDAAEACAALTA